MRKAADITEFVRRLTGKRPKSKITNGWVSMPCPLSPWTHIKGEDAHPSFGVKLQEGETRPAIFNCYTCKKKGTMSMLAQFYQDFSGKDCGDLIDEAENMEMYGLQLPLWEELTLAEPHLIAPDPLGEEYEDLFEPACRPIPLGAGDCHPYVHPYLASRGVSYHAARSIGIGHDPDDGHGVGRLTFPVRGPEGELYGYTGRALDAETVPRIRDYYGLPKRACLLGIHMLTDQTDVILCEGLFDFASLWSMGYPAVAAMHSGLTELQARLLRDLGKGVILMYDNDAAGKLGAKQAGKLIRDHVPVMKVKYPQGIKDPGDLARYHVEEMIRTRRLA
jgi:5S rRNA maturation endonuclease (ribonuclease M5)